MQGYWVFEGLKSMFGEFKIEIQGYQVFEVIRIGVLESRIRESKVKVQGH